MSILADLIHNKAEAYLKDRAIFPSLALSAVAGCSNAGQLLVDALTGPDCFAQSRSLLQIHPQVGWAVEAIAAIDVEELMRLSETWPISDLVTGNIDWSAWSYSFRHILDFGVSRSLLPDVNQFPQLHRFLSPSLVETPMTWADAVTYCSRTRNENNVSAYDYQLAMSLG